MLAYRTEARNQNHIAPVLADEMRRLSEFLDVVARLSTVDGAVLVDDRLAPHRFRCHIAAQRWSGQVLEGTVHTVKPTKPIDISQFGTRHNSAIALVCACPGVVAFVVSADGSVPTIMRIADDVVMWPDCLNTVFLD